MAWRHPGDKPLSDQMMVCFPDTYMRHSASVTYDGVFYCTEAHALYICRESMCRVHFWNTPHKTFGLMQNYGSPRVPEENIIISPSSKMMSRCNYLTTARSLGRHGKILSCSVDILFHKKKKPQDSKSLENKFISLQWLYISAWWLNMDFRESFVWLSIVLQKRCKIGPPSTCCSMLMGKRHRPQDKGVTCVWSLILG